MPITEDNYQKAEDWLSRAKSDPKADKAKIAKIEQDLVTFKQSQQYGPPEAPTQSPHQRGGVAGYFYEPSLDEFHNAMRDPETWKQVGSPDIRLNEQKDKTAGAAYIESKVPELAALNKADIEHVGEESPEYKSYSDYAYNQAKEKNPNVSRYSDLEITKSPFNKALGAVVKYGAPAALGAEKSLTLGVPRKAAEVIASNTPDSAADASYDAMGAPIGEYHPEKAEAVKQGVKDLESLSPTANTIGNIGGYLAPIAPANLAARGMMASLGYEAAGPLTKAAISGLTGSAVSSGEGAAQDLIEDPTIGWQELGNRTVPRAVMGGLGGSALDLVAQGAGRGQSAFEESPRWAPIKNQKDIGGNTNFITGIETSPNVKANIKAATVGRENKTAADIAAMKVAPQIRESVENQLKNKAGKITKEIEDYTKTPYGLEEHPADPVVDRLLSMAGKGTVSMPVSGEFASANKGLADSIRRNLQEFSTFQHLTPEEAKAITEQHGGRILTDKQAQVLSLPQESGKVNVVIPAKFNAEALLTKEDQIARNLKYDTKEGGVDNPVLQEMNLGFKEIRDKFKYPFVERRGAERPTNEQWQAMQKPEGINRNTPISEHVEVNTEPPVKSSVAHEPTEPPPVYSDPVGLNEVRGNKRYQEYSPSEYSKLAEGDNVDKSGNGYQQLVGPEDFAPGYRLRTNTNETASLAKLAQETDELGGKVSGETPEDYTPEFPREESEKTGWAGPYPKKGIRGELGNNSPFRPSRIGKDYGPEWSPNEDLYTLNPPENISASEAPEMVSETPVKSEKPESLFPDVTDQIGEPNKSEFAKADQTPDVGVVKDIVQKTDKLADGLTPEELDAIHSYTSRRGDKVGTKEWESATKKLTVDRPTAGGPLYHGTRMSQSDVDGILKNKSHSFTKPTSTSYNEGIASAAAYSRAQRGDVPVIFKIPEVDNGVSLASKKLGIRGTNNEKEILLNNKDFQVMGSRKDSEGNLVIELRQKDPNQLEATLDDGSKVYGFSAKRRQQHEDLKALEEAKKGTGSATKEGSHRRALDYKSGEGSPYENEQLAKEADRLGLRQELEEIPATRQYPGLRARAFGGSGEGPMNAVKDFAGFRLDPVLGAIAGEPRNPYTALPNTPAGRIQQYLFRQGVPMYPLLEQRGGLGAARFGNEVADEQRKNEER